MIKALPSVHVTAWSVLKNKLATKVNLERREVELESILCCLWGTNEGTTSHLFFGCIIVWLVSSIVPQTSVSYFLQFNIHEAPTFVNLILGNV